MWKNSDGVVAPPATVSAVSAQWSDSRMRRSRSASEETLTAPVNQSPFNNSLFFDWSL